ncbi:peptidase M48 [Desulfonema ishimotonii]|uniref:Peptidase M48 n=1 Tax=Desulfonema ishimotonii TaxID=45657 RepID=A0A401FW75_9BACT|nr:M48 family metallopeptidase [Desulfonema ishimotonii]GBC61218.1 peptidase M48 [Desulfonema ishimotonii]
MIRFTPRLPEENVNVTPVSPLRELFVLISGLIAVAVGIYFLLGFAVDLIVPHISPGLEHALARHITERFAGSEQTDDRSGALQSLADRLKNGCVDLPYDLTVFVADDARVNAVALPGGNIVVFSGLLEKMSSENEMAFVLLHEMGHFVHRDHLRGMGRALVLVALSAFFLGPDNPVGGMLVQGLHLSEMKFSREQETHADRFALRALNCSYGHIAGATEFFKKMGQEETPAGAIGQFYLSHPESRKRIAEMEAYGQANDFPARGVLRPLPDGIR